MPEHHGSKTDDDRPEQPGDRLLFQTVILAGKLRLLGETEVSPRSQKIRLKEISPNQAQDHDRQRSLCQRRAAGKRRGAPEELPVLRQRQGNRTGCIEPEKMNPGQVKRVSTQSRTVQDRTGWTHARQTDRLKWQDGGRLGPEQRRPGIGTGQTTQNRPPVQALRVRTEAGCQPNSHHQPPTRCLEPIHQCQNAR